MFGGRWVSGAFQIVGLWLVLKMVFPNKKQIVSVTDGGDSEAHLGHSNLWAHRQKMTLRHTYRTTCWLLHHGLAAALRAAWLHHHHGLLHYGLLGCCIMGWLLHHGLLRHASRAGWLLHHGLLGCRLFLDSGSRFDDFNATHKQIWKLDHVTAH